MQEIHWKTSEVTKGKKWLQTEELSVVGLFRLDEWPQRNSDRDLQIASDIRKMDEDWQ